MNIMNRKKWKFNKWKMNLRGKIMKFKVTRWSTIIEK